MTGIFEGPLTDRQKELLQQPREVQVIKTELGEYGTCGKCGETGRLMFDCYQFRDEIEGKWEIPSRVIAMVSSPRYLHVQCKCTREEDNKR